MPIEEQVQQLTNSQVRLRSLQEKLTENTRLMRDEAKQAFLFDLRDYLDSLSIITNSVEPIATNAAEVSEISSLLAEQNQLLQLLIEALSQQVEVGGTILGQKDGELRRTLGSLQGVLELNGLMLQDNLTFQRTLQVAGLSSSEVENKAEKPNIFQRLFKKSKS